MINCWIYFIFDIINYSIIWIKLNNFGSPCGPGSSSSKALGYGQDGPGSIPVIRGMEIFFAFSCQNWSWGPTQPPTKCVPEAFPGIKAAPSVGLAALPLPSAVAYYIHPHPPWAFMAWNENIFTFTLGVQYFVEKCLWVRGDKKVEYH